MNNTFPDFCIYHIGLQAPVLEVEAFVELINLGHELVIEIFSGSTNLVLCFLPMLSSDSVLIIFYSSYIKIAPFKSHISLTKHAYTTMEKVGFVVVFTTST